VGLTIICRACNFCSPMKRIEIGRSTKNKVTSNDWTWNCKLIEFDIIEFKMTNGIYLNLLICILFSEVEKLVVLTVIEFILNLQFQWFQLCKLFKYLNSRISKYIKVKVESCFIRFLEHIYYDRVLVSEGATLNCFYCSYIVCIHI
jgi:hypothetical protein